jgi:hypothetical protein
MRCTKAAYHYAIWQARRDEDSIARERIAEALVNDPNRNFWAEIKRIRNNKAGNNKAVDGCTGENNIAKVFVDKYKNLYTSVPYNTSELNDILAG